MYFVTDIKLVDMQSNSYRHLDSYNNKAKLRGDLLLSLYDDKSDTMTSMTVACRELNYFFRNAFKRYKILLPSKDFIGTVRHIALLPLLDYIDDYLGVVEVPNTSIVADDSTLGISDNHLFIKTRIDEYKILADYLVDHKYFLTENKLYIPDAQDNWHCYSLQPEFLKLHLKLVVKGVLKNNVLHNKY